MFPESGCTAVVLGYNKDCSFAAEFVVRMVGVAKRNKKKKTGIQMCGNEGVCVARGVGFCHAPDNTVVYCR